MAKGTLVRLVCGLVLAMLALSACARDQKTEPKAEAEIQKVEFTASEYRFEGPASVKAGLSSFSLRNEGKEGHMAGFMKLNTGVTLQQLLDQAKATRPPDAAVFRNASPHGGLSAKPGSRPRSSSVWRRATTS